MASAGEDEEDGHDEVDGSNLEKKKESLAKIQAMLDTTKVSIYNFFLICFFFFFN